MSIGTFYMLAYFFAALCVLCGFVSANRRRSLTPIVISTILGIFGFGFLYWVCPAIMKAAEHLTAKL